MQAWWTGGQLEHRSGHARYHIIHSFIASHLSIRCKPRPYRKQPPGKCSFEGKHTKDWLSRFGRDQQEYVSSGYVRSEAQERLKSLLSPPNLRVSFDPESCYIKHRTQCSQVCQRTKGDQHFWSVFWPLDHQKIFVLLQQKKSILYTGTAFLVFEERTGNSARDSTRLECLENPISLG